MLLYMSERKVQNLSEEFGLNRGFWEAVIPNAVKTRLDFNVGMADGSVESQHTMQETSQISQVLKKLKRNKNKSTGTLTELTGTTYVRPFHYYICDGKLSYEGRIDGQTASLFSSEILDRYRSKLFFADDQLKMKVKIFHDDYQSVDFTCTADSIQVFGYRNLSAYYGDVFKNGERLCHPNSADPGILERELPVRLIFWCLKADETLGQITGSPLLISC